MSKQVWKCSKCGGINPENKKYCLGCNDKKDDSVIEDIEKYNYAKNVRSHTTGIEIYCQGVTWMKLMNTVTCEVTLLNNVTRYPLKHDESVFIPIPPYVECDIAVGVAQALIGILTHVTKIHGYIKDGDIQCYQYIPPTKTSDSAILYFDLTINSETGIAYDRKAHENKEVKIKNKTCSKCGSINPSNAFYCKSCGGSLR